MKIWHQYAFYWYFNRFIAFNFTSFLTFVPKYKMFLNNLQTPKFVISQTHTFFLSKILLKNTKNKLFHYKYKLHRIRINKGVLKISTYGQDRADHIPFLDRCKVQLLQIENSGCSNNGRSYTHCSWSVKFILKTTDIKPYTHLCGLIKPIVW